MNDVQFDDSNMGRRQRQQDSKGKITKFLNRRGLSDDQARKVLYGIAIGAFLLSLFFWF